MHVGDFPKYHYVCYIYHEKDQHSFFPWPRLPGGSFSLANFSMQRYYSVPLQTLHSMA